MRTAVIIGRFQPIHKGHANLIQQAINNYDETFVVVANSPSSIVINSNRRRRAKGADIPKERDQEGWNKVAKKDVEKINQGKEKGLPGNEIDNVFPQGMYSKSNGKIIDKFTPSSKEKIEKIKKENPFSGMYRKLLIYKSFGGKLNKDHIISSKSKSFELAFKSVSKLTKSKDFVFISGEKNYIKPDEAQIKGLREKYPNINFSLPDYSEFSIRDEKSDDGDASYSATKVRKAIIDNDKNTFKKMTPPGIHDEFDKMKKFLMTEGQRSFFRRMLLEMVHIEDLKVGDFIKFVKDIYKAEASIKLDGTANLAFGLSEGGKLYTAFGRTAFHKGDVTPEEKRSYSVEEWLSKDKLYFNSAASAHAALEQSLEEIKKVLKPGQEASAELMFGDKPNCIKYDFGGVNHIVILNNQELAQVLNKKVVHINTTNLVIDTDELKRKKVKQTWTFGQVEKVDPKKYDINISEELKDLESFLEAETEGFRNIDILGMAARGKNKEMVQAVREKAQKLKLNVKEKLLQQFVRQVREGSYIPSQGYSHEGVVLKGSDGTMTKIIDKDVFTSIHERDWKPSHDADKVIKSFQKQGISKEEALDYLNDRINNFDKYYSDVAEDMKDRMKNALKMMRIELKKEK